MRRNHADCGGESHRRRMMNGNIRSQEHFFRTCGGCLVKVVGMSERFKLQMGMNGGGNGVVRLNMEFKS